MIFEVTPVSRCNTLWNHMRCTYMVPCHRVCIMFPPCLHCINKRTSQQRTKRDNNIYPRAASPPRQALPGAPHHGGQPALPPRVQGPGGGRDHRGDGTGHKPAAGGAGLYPVAGVQRWSHRLQDTLRCRMPSQHAAHHPSRLQAPRSTGTMCTSLQRHRLT